MALAAAAAPAIDRYDSLLGTLYDAALEEQGWQQALRALHELFAANYVTLILRPPGEDSDQG